MSEKQTHNPEASSQTVDDLYQLAADYLETMLHHGKTSIEPTTAVSGDLLVRVEIPELNGKRLRLEYERAAQEHDRTVVDRDIPLAWSDETGDNRWHTPINIKVYGNNETPIHDYDVIHSGPDTKGKLLPAMTYDKHLQPGTDPNADLPAMTALDANELQAHLEWALEGQA